MTDLVIGSGNEEKYWAAEAGWGIKYGMGHERKCVPVQVVLAHQEPETPWKELLLTLGTRDGIRVCSIGFT